MPALPLESLVNQYSGKTAQELTDLLNADQVAWRPVPLSTLGALVDKLGISVFIEMLDATVGWDSPIKLAVSAAIRLLDKSKYENLDLQDSDIRTQVTTVLGALSQVPNSTVTADGIAAILALGSTTTNIAKQVNGGELLTVDQVQAAMDRSAVRTLFSIWKNTAEDRINGDPAVPSLNDLLATPQ